MGTRSRMHNTRRKLTRWTKCKDPEKTPDFVPRIQRKPPPKFRSNHAPEWKERRSYSKKRRKLLRPLNMLRAHRTLFKATLAAHGIPDRETAENIHDLPEDVAKALTTLSDAEAEYFDYVASTQLRKGHYAEHEPSRILKQTIDKVAIEKAEVDVENPDLEKVALAASLAEAFTDKLCRRQFSPGRKRRGVSR